MATLQRPTVAPSQLAVAADAPKVDKLSELSEDDADLVQVIFAALCAVKSDLFRTSLMRLQRLAIMMLKNELPSSNAFRTINITHRLFVEVRSLRRVCVQIC